MALNLQSSLSASGVLTLPMLRHAHHHRKFVSTLKVPCKPAVGCRPRWELFIITSSKKLTVRCCVCASLPHSNRKRWGQWRQKISDEPKSLPLFLKYKYKTLHLTSLVVILWRFKWYVCELLYESLRSWVVFIQLFTRSKFLYFESDD